MSTKKTADEPEAIKAKDTRRFLVETGLSGISHGEQVFPVEEGVVELPKLPADQCWYADLIEAGILVEE